MNTSALIMMVLTQTLVTGCTVYLFVKILKLNGANSEEDEDESANQDIA